MATVDGKTIVNEYYAGDSAIFTIIDGSIVRKNIINGYQRTGYTQNFRLFATITSGALLPTQYPDAATLEGLGWPRHIVELLADQPIETFGESASETYTYVAYDPNDYDTVITVQQPVDAYVPGYVA